jgi:DNA-binding CsgD family transcriptional regulator
MIVLPSKEESVTACLSFNSREDLAANATIPAATLASMLMVHDPTQRRVSTGRMLQDLYGLTHAEVHLVQALSMGVSPANYARERHVSITTVSTHLRRAREKTGLRSAAELIRRYLELSGASQAH